MIMMPELGTESAAGKIDNMIQTQNSLYEYRFIPHYTNTLFSDIVEASLWVYTWGVVESEINRLVA